MFLRCNYWSRFVIYCSSDPKHGLRAAAASTKWPKRTPNDWPHIAVMYYHKSDTLTLHRGRPSAMSSSEYVLRPQTIEYSFLLRSVENRKECCGQCSVQFSILKWFRYISFFDKDTITNCSLPSTLTGNRRSYAWSNFIIFNTFVPVNTKCNAI